jgi:hypothetical protein
MDGLGVELARGKPVRRYGKKPKIFGNESSVAPACIRPEMIGRNPGTSETTPEFRLHRRDKIELLVAPQILKLSTAVTDMAYRVVACCPSSDTLNDTSLMNVMRNRTGCPVNAKSHCLEQSGDFTVCLYYSYLKN